MKVLHMLYSGLGGHGNVFFSMVDADKEKTFTYEALFFGIEDVRQAYISKTAERNLSWYSVKKKPGIDLKSYKKIASIIKKSAPDIVFIHTSGYIFPVKWAAIFSRKKIKIIVRETQANHLKTKFEWIGLGVALITANKVVFLSTEYRDTVKQKLFLLFSAGKTAVVPNGINLSLFKPQLKNTSPSTIFIGMQSRLTSIKDHTTLIKAFSNILIENNTGKKIKLLIAGDGAHKSILEQQVHELGIATEVVFLGMLDENELPSFINSLNVYIHATLGETMSTAIMQVMACGIPIIASDVPGVNNMIVNDKTGLLVPAKNSAALTSAINYLLNNPIIATRLANTAFDFARKNYSNETMLQRYKKVFEED